MLLRAWKLTKTFGGQEVLRDISLELRPGEVVLLRGANGSGKTTLLNILTGVLKPDSGHIEVYAGRGTIKFFFPRRWWQELDPRNTFSPDRLARNGVGRSWQDVRLFPNHSLLENIVLAAQSQLGENPLWALIRLGKLRHQEEDLFKQGQKLLQRLRLTERANSPGSRVSLGQSKRIAIARTVQAGAQVLFLDEPLGGLDTAGVREVLGLLADVVRQRNVSLVIVEHISNIVNLLGLATTVWTLEDGRIHVADSLDEEGGSTQDALIETWMKQLSLFYSYENSRTLSGGAILTIFGTTLEGEKILEVSNLEVARGPRPILRDLNFSLRSGELAVLQAPNGWGKTTLLEALAGLLPVKGGRIRFRSTDIESLQPWERSQLGLLLLQARENHFPSLTVQESLRVAGVEILSEDIARFANRRVSALSGGERQRVALASFQSRSGALRLLDEPFSALDSRSLNGVRQWLTPKKGEAFLIALPTTLKETQDASITRD